MDEGLASRLLGWSVEPALVALDPPELALRVAGERVAAPPRQEPVARGAQARARGRAPEDARLVDEERLEDRGVPLGGEAQELREVVDDLVPLPPRVALLEELEPEEE